MPKGRKNTSSSSASAAASAAAPAPPAQPTQTQTPEVSEPQPAAVESSTAAEPSSSAPPVEQPSQSQTQEGEDKEREAEAETQVPEKSRAQEEQEENTRPSTPSNSSEAGSSESNDNDIVVVEPQVYGEEAEAEAEKEKEAEKVKDTEKEREKAEVDSDASRATITPATTTTTTTTDDNVSDTPTASTTTSTIPAAVEAATETVRSAVSTAEAAISTAVKTAVGAAVVAASAVPVPSAAAVPLSLRDTVRERKLRKCITKTNDFISHLNRLLSTSSGKDRALMVLSYSITALTAHLDKISLLRSLAHSTDPQKVSVIPVGLSGFILFARDHQSSRLAAVSTRLKALASLISDVRIFMRLWGLLGIYEWGLSTYRAPPKDKTLRNIAYAQVAVNVFYQILENLAYLGQHKVLPVGPKRQNKFWLWSSRFWMMHVVLEFWRLKRDRDLNLKKGKAVEEKEKKAAGAVGEGEVEKKIKWYDFGAVLKSQTREGLWLKQLWSNAAYAPLTVHWSLESGALSPLSVGTLGTIAGVIGLQQAWRNSA